VERPLPPCWPPQAPVWAVEPVLARWSHPVYGPHPWVSEAIDIILLALAFDCMCFAKLGGWAFLLLRTQVEGVVGGQVKTVVGGLGH
jgi:hypothetical protein